MLPAFADIEAMEARTPGGISEADEPRAQAALDDASTIIRTVGGKNYVDDADPPGLADVPDVVVMVTLRAAIRAFVNPDGVTQETEGPFSRSYGNASTDVYLTAAERAMVKEAAGKTGLTVHQVTRGPIETKTVSCGPYAVADEYLPVDPPGKDLPFL